MIFRLTNQQCSNANGLVPQKVCPCQQSFPAIAFIKYQHMRADGSSLISDAPLCYLCEPPPVFLYTYVARWKRGVLKDELALDLTLRDENGEPIRSFDKKRHRWRALSSVGLRLMTDTNDIRMQPYDDRSTDIEGVSYLRKQRDRLFPKLPLDDDNG